MLDDLSPVRIVDVRQSRFEPAPEERSALVAAQSRVEILDVPLDRALGPVKSTRDLRIAQALGNETEHIELAAGECSQGAPVGLDQLDTPDRRGVSPARLSESEPESPDDHREGRRHAEFHGEDRPLKPLPAEDLDGGHDRAGLQNFPDHVDPLGAPLGAEEVRNRPAEHR